MRLTIPHYFRLPMAGDLDGPAAWDSLRSTTSPFAVPATRTAWECAADARPEYAERAAAVAAVADRLGVTTVASYGVGSGLLERHLVGRVEHLRCGDFTPQAIARVAELMPEAQVQLHDLTTDPPMSADLHLFHRVDTEFTDAQWRTILGRFDGPVLFAFSELLTPKGVVRELLTRLRGGRKVGWFRTEDAFRAAIPARFSVERLQIGDLPGFLLSDRPGG